jgi:PAS domain S-box-containing protein
LSDQTEDYEDLYENAPCGYLSLRANGSIFKSNLTFTQWTGYESEKLAGMKFYDLLNIAGRIYYETHFAPLLRMQGHFNEVALEIVKADGSRLPVLVNAAERRDADGKAVFTRLTIFNASDRRRYERELLAARDELRRLNANLETRVNEVVAEQLRHADVIDQHRPFHLQIGLDHNFRVGALQLVDHLLQCRLQGQDRRVEHDPPAKPSSCEIHDVVDQSGHPEHALFHHGAH